MRLDDCGIPVFDNEEEQNEYLSAEAERQRDREEPEPEFCRYCKMALADDAPDDDCGECPMPDPPPKDWVERLADSTIRTALVQDKRRFAKAIGDLRQLVQQGQLDFHTTRYESAKLLVKACEAEDFVESCQCTRAAYYTSDGANEGVIPCLGAEPQRVWNEIIGVMVDMEVI